MKTLKIKDAGAIPELIIQVPEAGVVVLRGPNGSGKTTALNAVQALISGTGTVPTRDGALGAVVEGFGARLTVGRRTGRAGELELHALEGPDPSLLVDPGIKDRGAAHAERIKALCRLAGPEIYRDAFVRLVSDPEDFARVVKPDSLLKGDVPSVAAAIKRDFEAAARLAETSADNLQTEARGIAAGAEDVPETEAPDERAIQRELEAASAALGELRGRQSQVSALRESAARARETLASYGDKGTAEAGQRAEAALDAAKSRTREAQAEDERATQSVTAARAALIEAERQAAVARGALTTAQAGEAHAAEVVEQAFADFQRRKQLQAASVAADAAADVDPAQIQELEERQLKARVALQRCEVVRRAIQQRERARVKAEESGNARARANDLREAARGCEGIVSAALAKVCPAGMSVHEGLLVVETDRGLEPFDELSHGERWRWTLGICARTIKAPGLLICRQEGWESLDPATQKSVDAMARELGIVILAAKADDGELRSELFGEVGA